MSIWVPSLVLVLALVPLGARSPLALNIVLLVVAGLFLFTLARSAIKQRGAGPAAPITQDTNMPALLALPLLAVLQVAWLHMVSSGRVATASTTQAAALLAVYAAFFLLVHMRTGGAREFRTLLAGLALIGTLEALYAVLNLLGGNERLLIYERWAYPDSATGTLISRNHFAFLMEMTLPAAAAFSTVFAIQRAGAGSVKTERSERRARQVLVGSAVVAMGLALIFSRSRMGILSFVMALATVGAASRLLQPRRRSDARGTLGGALPLVLGVTALGYALVIGIEPVLERFLNIPQDVEHGRLHIWRATAAMFVDRPLLGHGWGTFEGLLPGYRPRPTGLFFTHAHNEYLQVLAEAGVVGLSIVAWLIFLFARRLTRTLALPLSRPQRTVVVSLGVAITSVLFHSAADFGLRVPGVALTFVFVVALFSRVTADPTLVDPVSTHDEIGTRPP